MKKLISFRVTTLALLASSIFKTASVDADVTFVGVAAGDATSNDVIVWTRAKDESNPQPTDINVQITTDPAFNTGVTTLFAGTAAALADYTVKTNIGSLQSATIYYYRFQTTDGLITSNVGKVKTAPDPMARVAVRFGVSGDYDGLIRPYALASQVPSKNLDFFMFDWDTEYETSASIGSPAVHSTGNIPDPTVIVPTATQSQLFTDFSRKYREQFLPVNVGGQNCLQPTSPGRAITRHTTITNSATSNTSMEARQPVTELAALPATHRLIFPQVPASMRVTLPTTSLPITAAFLSSIRAGASSSCSRCISTTNRSKMVAHSICLPIRVPTAPGSSFSHSNGAGTLS
jgi:hypothetical protein